LAKSIISDVVAIEFILIYKCWGRFYSPPFLD